MSDPIQLPVAPLADPAPGRARRAVRLLWRISVALGVSAFTLLFVAWLALHWAILPHIDRWRPLIERETGKALGVMVRIGSIEVRSGGWMPTLELREVALLDAQSRPALALERVVASLSARSIAASLASLELRLAQLVIDGARLEVRRDPAGRLFVAGLELGAAAGDGGGATDWVLHQGEIAIRGATLRWTDEQRGAPALELDAVDLVLRNTLRQHRLRLDATPPADWGERFTLRGQFRQPLLGRAGDWQQWSGQVYADAPRADASRLRAYVDLPFELSRGVGALRAWLEVRKGLPGALTLDVALREAELRLATDLEPLVVDELQGRLVAQRRDDGSGNIALRDFGFVTGAGVRWPRGDLDLAWKRAPDGSLSGGEFKAERLDLALIADTATRLPLPAPVRKLLREAQPQGIANAVRASWTGPLDALTHYSVGMRLSAVSLASQPPAEGHRIGRPGLSKVDIELNASEKGGDARIAMQDGSIDLPGVFAEPVIPLDALRAQLLWRIEPVPGAPAALQVQVRGAQIANADAQGELDATWSSGNGSVRLPGRLELDGTLTRGQAQRVARYLPLGLPEAARRYIEQSVQGGNITKAGFRVRGDLADFPHFAGSAAGELRIAIDVEDLTLAYVPGAEPPWPALTRARGELVFDRGGFEFRNAQGRILGVELGALRGGIRSFAEPPLLTLETAARGPLADMLRFVNATPAGRGLRGALGEASASGEGELKLALKLPLRDLARTGVSGSLTLPGNDLHLRADLPTLAAASGRIAFTEQGVSKVEARARLLGGEASIEGGGGADGPLRLVVQGRASAEALRQTPELGAAARVATALSGQAAYRLALAIDARGRTDFDLTSDLAGLASDLPPPLAKRADAALPLRLHSEHLPTTAGAAAQDQWQIELGNVLHAAFVRDLSVEPARVLRGGIGVFQPAPTPASGVSAALELAHLDLDAWNATAQRLSGGAASTDLDAGDGGGWLPTQIGLKAQSISVSGQRLTQVSAGLSRHDGLWRANVDAEQLSGYVEYQPPSAGGAQAGRVRARLARLALQRNESDEVTRLLERQPATVPALDIVIEDLQLRGRALGRLEVQAVNRAKPDREWELTRLNLALPEAKFSASGRWAASPQAAGTGAGTPSPRQAEYRFQLDIADSGALLRRFGNPDAIRGGRGTVQGNVSWIGSPLQPDFPSATGQFKVAIEEGQFLHAQTGGAARLLSVLSLQGLIRRLSLDFRDLSQDGFAFDSVTGDVAIARGVASTNNLVMRGAQAAILLEGSADANTETQDLRVYVVPEINLGAASLAYAVINPVVGLSTFVAQLFLREPLAQANTREFRIVGSWADPQIEPVARQPAQAAPRIGAPAAGGSAPATANEVAQ